MLNKKTHNQCRLDKSAAIVALARDCAEPLKRSIPKIERLRSFFSNSTVVVVENDSIDDTKKVLQQWTETASDVIILSRDVYEDTTPKKSAKLINPASSAVRIEKMCRFRNIYMDYLHNRAGTSEQVLFDFIIVIDIDVEELSEDTILDAVTSAPDDWVALFSNGVKYIAPFGRKIRCRYYDDSAYIPFTEDAAVCMELTVDEMKLNRDALSKEMKKSAFVKCLSAFGGIGIYRYQYIRDTHYKTQANTKNHYAESICEHIPINLSLRTHGACYVVRDLLVYNKHILTIKDLFSELIPTRLWLALYRILNSPRIK
ncbi:hypothetical protein FACS1894109_04460 [Spirochaetia bacterium]|nr:hypothetical protein FACS1894109_04460 [Spirochaetia bacterium]